MRTTILSLTVTALFAGTALAGDDDSDDRSRARTYEVTITNITPGEAFTPILAATHKSSISFFQLGEPASPELAELAESGSTASLADLLASVPDQVFDTAVSEGLLGPGEHVTLTIHSTRRFNRLSFAAMLIPTNDTFVALNSVRLPRFGSDSYTVPAYDADSEVNDELCASIPGPPCFGEGTSDDDGEGSVHISSGIHGIGDLAPALHDWRNPVAHVTVRRVH